MQYFCNEISPINKETNLDENLNYNKSVFKGLLHSIRKDIKCNGHNDNFPEKTQGAFINLLENGNSNKKKENEKKIENEKKTENNKNIINWSSGKSKDETLVNLIESIEKNKKIMMKNQKWNQTVGDFVNELKQFNENLEKEGKKPNFDA